MTTEVALREARKGLESWKKAYQILMDYGERKFGDEFWPGNDEEFVERMEKEAKISVE